MGLDKRNLFKRLQGRLVIALHPFFSIDRAAYIPVGEMAIGEKVKVAGDRTAALTEARKRTNGPEKVYNFEVWREHNYFVGKEGVLVHNTGCLDWMWNVPRTYAGGIVETCLEHIKRGYLFGAAANKSFFGAHIVTDNDLKNVLQKAMEDFADNLPNTKFKPDGYAPGKHQILVDMSVHPNLLSGGSIGKYVSSNGATRLDVTHILVTIDDNLNMINAFPTNKILSTF